MQNYSIFSENLSTNKCFDIYTDVLFQGSDEVSAISVMSENCNSYEVVGSDTIFSETKNSPLANVDIERPPAPLGNYNNKTEDIIKEDILVSCEIRKQLSTTPDEYTAFGQYVAAELRKLSNPYAVAVAKHKINDILFFTTVGAFSDNQVSSNHLFNHLGHVNSFSSNSISLEDYLFVKTNNQSQNS